MSAVIETMISLFLMLGLGYVLRRRDVLDEVTCRKLSSLVVNVTCPFLSLASVANSDGSNRSEILSVLGIGILAYAVLILFGFLLTRTPIFPKEDFISS